MEGNVLARLVHSNHVLDNAGCELYWLSGSSAQSCNVGVS